MKDKFLGFSQNQYKDWWPYPKELSQWWCELTGSEQKVLDFILRHTLGFQKTSDAISYRQFIKGVRNCDKGCGIKSTTTLSRAFKRLIKMGFITTVGGRITGQSTEYSLVYKNEEKEGESLLKIKSRSVKSKKVGSLETKDTINSKTIEYLQYIYKNKKSNNYSSIDDITEDDLIEISKKYQVPIGLVNLQLEKLINWCKANDQSYKNYKRALMSWVLNDIQRKEEKGQVYDFIDVINIH